MKPLYFVPMLAVLCMVPIGFVSAQTDTVPSWVRGVAGFWADGGMSDAEFIDAIEFLIDREIISIGKIDGAIDERDNRIEELERMIADEKRHHIELVEILEQTNVRLRDVIDELFEEMGRTSAAATPSSDAQKESRITIDGQAYTAGDAIRITVNADPSEAPERINAKGETMQYEKQTLRVRILTAETLMGVGIVTTCSGPANSALTHCSSYNESVPGGLDALRLVGADSDGTLSFETHVGDNTEVNDYVVIINYHVDQHSNVIREKAHFSIFPSS